MLISFSGLDGAGKTTQIENLLHAFQHIGFQTGSVYDLYTDIRYHSIQDLRNLYDYLEKYDVVHLRFRLNSDENSLLMSELEYSNFENPYLTKATALQGYFDYIQLYRYVVLPLIRKKKVILSDRHYYDEIVFKCAYGCNYSSMRKMYVDCIKPDIAFYISGNPEEIYQRNINRPDGKTTLYSNITYIYRLNELFKQLLKDTELIEINGAQSRENIFNHIRDALHEVAGLHFL